LVFEQQMSIVARQAAAIGAAGAVLFLLALGGCLDGSLTFLALGHEAARALIALLMHTLARRRGARMTVAVQAGAHESIAHRSFEVLRFCRELARCRGAGGEHEGEGEQSDRASRG